MATQEMTLFGEDYSGQQSGSSGQAAYSKQYYTIGEVASMFGVRSSNIRFWTTEFALKVRTTQRGDRLYTPAIIEELKQIYHLVKEEGYTIAGAKARLREGSDNGPDLKQIKETLLRLRNQLLLIRNELL